jgi:hypothetical protein
MQEDEQESEAERMHRDVATARRSFIIIYSVGIIGIVATIVFVMKNRPAGNLDGGTGRPAPALTPRYAPKPCKKFGDSCELSPGKLGTCIQREQCTGEHCLYCQSQH